MLPRRHDHRAVAVAHAGAAGAEEIVVGQIGVGVQADGRQLQLAGEGAAVERFDIDQLVAEFVIAGVDLAVGQGVEHEGVVRIGAMADADQLADGGQNDSPFKKRGLKAQPGDAATASAVVATAAMATAATARALTTCAAIRANHRRR